MAKKTYLISFGIQWLDITGKPVVDLDSEGCEYEVPWENQGVIISLPREDLRVAKRRVLHLLERGEFAPVNSSGSDFAFDPRRMRVEVWGLKCLTSKGWEVWCDAYFDARGGRDFKSRRNQKCKKAYRKYHAQSTQRDKERRVLAAMRAAKKLRSYDLFLVKRGGIMYEVDEWGWMRKYVAPDFGGDDE